MEKKLKFTKTAVEQIVKMTQADQKNKYFRIRKFRSLSRVW